MSSERRRNTRWSLMLFVPIYDAETDNVLGYIADINAEGMMLFSHEPVELGKTFLLELHRSDLEEALLNQNISVERLRFRAKSRWVDNGVENDFHRTGLMFLNLSEQDHTIIKQIVDNTQQLAKPVISSE